jgi:RNA polymerase sigma-70 factor (ECF subfamily)
MGPPQGLPHPDQLEQAIADARAGSREALGHLLETCRQYLLLVANREVPRALAAKLAPSDLVQETFLKAHREFGQFQGQTEAELLGWLRRILLNSFLSFSRQYQGTVKRQLGRELSIGEADLGELQNGIASAAESPSAQAIAREQDEGLQKALDRLPASARQLIHWRNHERLSFEEIGRRAGKTAQAIRKAWVRAVKQLRDILEPPQ